MVLYTHYEKSAVCASSGLYVGKKDSEVQAVDPSGRQRHFLNGSAGAYQVAAGNFSCSRSATINTGLTTLSAVYVGVRGKVIAGKVNTLDLICTPDNSAGKKLTAVSVQARWGTNKTTGGYFWVKGFNASGDRSKKRTLMTYFAIGT